MLLDPAKVKHFKKWVESQNLQAGEACIRNIGFLSEVYTLRKKPPSDTASAAQKIVGRYIGMEDGVAAITCNRNKLDAFRRVYSLFGAASAGVFDELFDDVRAPIFPLWMKYGRAMVAKRADGAPPQNSGSAARQTESPAQPSTPVSEPATPSASPVATEPPRSAERRTPADLLNKLKMRTEALDGTSSTNPAAATGASPSSYDI